MVKETKYSGDKIVGLVFGRLTVLENLGVIKKDRKVLVECECGTRYEVKFDTVLTGQSKSCGCLQREIVKKKFTTHGLSKHPLRGVHKAMLNRCYKKDDPQYENYGGKGVIICEEWRNSYEIFANWALENGWQKGLHIDKDKLAPEKPGKIYSPEFCLFLTCKENSQYKGDNRMLTYNGETLSASQWADKFGMKYNTFMVRLENGWDFEKIANKPVRVDKLYLNYNGEYIHINDLAKAFNISTGSIRNRIKDGWTVERAVETPIDSRFSHRKKEA